ARSGEAQLWAAVRGEPAHRTARAVVSAASVDLALATRGRLHGRGNVNAAFGVGPGGARGALIAHGDLEVPDLPLRHAGLAVLGSLDGATAMILGSGDDA